MRVSPDELGARIVSLVDGATADVSFGQLSVDVPPEAWVDAARTVRDDADIACHFFDWLSAYDDGDAGLAVVLHAWSTAQRHHLLLRTRVAREDGRLASLTGVWPGAKEPGESDRDTHGSPGRRRMLPPGVPSPDEWGPDRARNDVAAAGDNDAGDPE